MNGTNFNGANLFNNFQNGPVTVNPPIVNRTTNVVNRYFYIDQPYINEVETQYVNHYVKRNKCYVRPICCEKNVYCEVNCGCCNTNNNLYNDQYNNCNR